MPRPDTDALSIETIVSRFREEGFVSTGEVATTVTVRYPMNAPVFEETAAVSPGAITRVTLPTSASGAWVSDAVADNLVHAFAEEEFVAYMVNLRIFSNAEGKLDHSVRDIGGEVLAVPQFTLYGKSLKGRRPDFTDALDPAIASPAFGAFRRALSTALGMPVPGGVFGADMQVALVNDGPLTLSFEF